MATTKRIKFVSGIAGDNFSFGPGDITDWDAVEADRFIAKGIARLVITEEVTELPAKAAQRI